MDAEDDERRRSARTPPRSAPRSGVRWERRPSPPNTEPTTIGETPSASACRRRLGSQTTKAPPTDGKGVDQAPFLRRRRAPFRGLFVVAGAAQARARWPSSRLTHDSESASSLSRGQTRHRGGRGGAWASTVGASAARATWSAAAPNRSSRPPKAIAQIENHAKPSARPAITSLSQCTPRSTRLPATMTASPAATPAIAARAGPLAAAAEQERRRREERGRPGRVAARERRPERLGDRVQRRPHAIGEVLDGRGEDAVPGDDDEQERHDPPAPGPHRLDDGQHGGEHGDDHGLAQVGDGVEPVGRERRRVPVAPVRHAVVQPDEIGVTADQIGEHRRAARHPPTITRSASVSARPVAACGSSRVASAVPRRDGAESPRRLARRARCDGAAGPLRPPSAR